LVVFGAAFVTGSGFALVADLALAPAVTATGAARLPGKVFATLLEVAMVFSS
jgi:hypothetical protein